MMHQAAKRTQHDNLSCAGIGAESHFRVEEGVRLAIIDNGTWAPTAGKQMRAVIDTMKNMTVLENPITIKSALAANQLASLDALAEELAKQVNG